MRCDIPRASIFGIKLQIIKKDRSETKSDSVKICELETDRQLRQLHCFIKDNRIFYTFTSLSPGSKYKVIVKSYHRLDSSQKEQESEEDNLEVQTSKSKFVPECFKKSSFEF